MLITITSILQGNIQFYLSLGILIFIVIAGSVSFYLLLKAKRLLKEVKVRQEKVNADYLAAIAIFEQILEKDKKLLAKQKEFNQKMSSISIYGCWFSDN